MSLAKRCCDMSYEQNNKEERRKKRREKRQKKRMNTASALRRRRRPPPGDVLCDGGGTPEGEKGCLCLCGDDDYDGGRRSHGVYLGCGVYLDYEIDLVLDPSANFLCANGVSDGVTFSQGKDQFLSCSVCARV